MAREAVIEKRGMARLRALPRVWFERICQVSKRGTPDELGVVDGVFFGLEWKKSAKEKPTPIQLEKLQGIREAGGIALVVCPENFEEVYQAIRERKLCPTCGRITSFDLALK